MKTLQRPRFFPAAILAALTGLAVSASAQVLLSTSEFALLGGTAITVGGPGPNAVVNGHVGLSPAATTNITGFPPAVVSGHTLSGAAAAIIATGGTTSQARLDLITAHNALAAMPSNTNVSNVDLGTMAALFSGVYTFNGAATQTGALVLDAQGQNGVAWVFQIGTSLTTAVNSTVTFINLGSNGGNDLGVFWNTGTAITIGDNNTILGNYLAGTSISFTGSTATLGNGGARALALAGVSFAGPATLNALGGPGGGDWDGGLMYNALGQLVPSLSPIVPLVPGVPPAPVVVPPGTTTGGVGVISNDVTNNGTLSPGFAPGVITPGVTTPGTLNVANNFVQGRSGTLVIQLASPTAYDQLVVTGTAALAGTLQVDVLNGFNPLGSSFPVLLANGGVSGKFDTVNGTAFATNRAAIGGTVTYGPQTVTVAFVQLPFSGFAQTPNQAALARAAQASPALTVALDTIPLAGQFPAALNALSPQGYAVWSEAAFSQATALTDRLARADNALAGRDDFYFDASERRTRMAGNADVGETVFTNSYGLVGGNTVVNPGFTLGGFFSFGRMTASLGSPGSSTEMKDKMPGVRAAWSAPTGWFSEAVLAYGFDHYESTRPVVFPGTAAVATSSTSGHQWVGDFTFGKHITNGAVTFSPFAGLLADRWHANGFTETGAGAYNLTVADQSARSLRSQLGAELRLNRGFLQPHIRAAWLHEFSNHARDIDASFGAVNYAIHTRDPQRDSALVGAGLDFVFGPRALLYADVTAQTGGDIKLLSAWRVGVSVSF